MKKCVYIQIIAVMVMFLFWSCVVDQGRVKSAKGVQVQPQSEWFSESAGAYYHFIEADVAGVPTIISRTGYTGEDGFELYFAADKAQMIWSQLLKTGAGDGLVPIGLGARDTLRLEKKYALYGHELSESISPLEAGLGWITKLDKPSFVGQTALQKMKKKGVPRRLVAIRMSDKGIPRDEYPVFVGEKEVGVVTSGTMSPLLKVGIALALVDSSVATIGTEVEIGIRQRRVAAEIIKPPFV